MQIPGYQIERELGQGGMAIVYLALQESLHRHVALKVIKPILTTDEEFAQRFLREGRIIAQLSDPHIVTVYDIASHEGTYYLSMEYLPGGTLQQRIRSGLPLTEALSIAQAIVGALHYAHRRGIIHRDIKPQNILFRENGQAVLTDFGIAKTLGASTIMTRTGLSIGTPRYMSPEQIRGQGMDTRADLYSFGVLFYEMLTGNVPYTAEDSFALAMMHVTAPAPDLPPPLSRFQPLLNRLLDKDPNRRFQNGQDFIAALDALEAGRGTPLSGLGGSGRSAAGAFPPALRFGWKTGMLVATLTGAALAGGYLFLYQPGLPTPPPIATPLPTPAVVDDSLRRQADADRLLGQARQHQQSGALASSLESIEQGLRLAPDHPALLALREDVIRQLTHFRDPVDRGLPDVDEQQLQAQLQAEQFLDQARRARQEGALELSMIHIEQGLQAMPDSPVLLAIKREVQEQLAELRRQEELARQQAEAEERQTAELARQQAEAEQRRVKAEEFLARALDDQRNRAYETSLLQIEQGLQQTPDHPRLLALRREVRKQLRDAQAPPPPTPTPAPTDDRSRITALLGECDAHLRANRLTMGRGGNAADCYGQVLKRDRGNAEALAGLDKIADRYVELITDALRRGDAKTAKSSLDRLAGLNPQHARLPDLRERLAQAETPARPTSPPPVAIPSPPEPAPRPVTPPPINLVSVPSPAEEAPEPAVSETRIIAQDPHTRLSRTETDDNVSLLVTTSPQGTLGATIPPDRETAAASQAQIYIQADVEDAEVWINNRKAGTTPLAVDLRPGSYQVRVSRDGHTDWNGRIDLAPGDESTLAAVLPRKLDIAAAKPVTRPPEPEPDPEPVTDPEPRPEPAVEPSPPRSEPRTVASAVQAPGCLSGNCQNGQGAYRFPDGSEYSGEFRDAKLNGQGAYVYAGRGEKYVGAWRNGVINGQGVYYYRSGNRYEGEWRNGRKSGQGTYFYADRGDKYVGDFANDQPNGQGAYYYRNGDRYEGEWSNGRKHGQGVLYEGGRTIVGEWRNDQKLQVRVEQ
ncbi:MAG: protein kinase [Candidatus Competibacteraceae bacterium]|nr:protein kinase [Candidatus Competibacteraceae bacterium]